MSSTLNRIKELGLTIPEPPPPAANYVPFVRTGSLLHISGQVSIQGTQGIYGVVGRDIDLDEGKRAARMCALNLISRIREACDGDWGRLKKFVKINGFVQVHREFGDIPLVVNGASDLIVELFGIAGQHSRSAIGVYRLPRNHSVEIDAVVELAT